MRPPHPWKARFLTVCIAVFICVLSEWLFFVTKPSFLSAVSWPHKIGVLFTTFALPVLIFALLHILFGLLRLEGFGKYFLLTAGAAFLSGSLFLMIDNFTITLFDFGIRSLQFPATVVYIALFTFLIISCFRWLSSAEGRIATIRNSTLSVLVAVILATSLVLVLTRYLMARSLLQEYGSRLTESRKLPNILMIGSDGVNADHMGLYGYPKNTTPVISKFASTSRIFLNAYPNASRTLASLVSMLTGKLPIDTRITCPPDILRGEDGYQHLPGILRRQGYRSIQLTVRDYGDAVDANMRMAFDVVNFRRADELKLFELTAPFLDQESGYLAYQSYERLSERILHAFGLRKMPDSLAEVLGKKRETFPDSERVRKLLEFVDASRDPFFAHVHFMGTHKNRIKNPGKSEAALIGPDGIPSFYDDAIQRFDESFGRIMEHLRQTGKLESTIVVIYSDHGWKHATKNRVPLLIRFPNGSHSGTVDEIVQNIDIAPTILDYLNIPKPQWMSGESLIASGMTPCRPVFSVWPIQTFDQQQKWEIRAEAKPPYYTLGAVSLVTCSHFYKYDLDRQRLNSDLLPNADCSRCKPFHRAQVMQFILQRLRASGYEVSW